MARNISTLTELDNEIVRLAGLYHRRAHRARLIREATAIRRVLGLVK